MPVVEDRPHLAAFRGVETSVTGQRWVGLLPEHDRMAMAIAERTGLPDLVSRVLARQGATPDSAQGYLLPKLRDLMPDPSTLKDLDKAVDRFSVAVENRERIAIFADYDVDGGSSAALLIDWLRQSGMSATLYVPDRIDEGFGPNVGAMTELAKGHDLIICVDCGTSAFEPIGAAGNTDVLVLDHHVGDASLPPAHAIVNPNRQDETSELVQLCAAGVVFMFLVALNRKLRSRRQDLPDLMQMLDLVALATVADVSPMTGLNRAFVRNGVKVMRSRRRPGLRALFDVCRISTAPNYGHLGFVLGPRINAGGRIGQSDLGARLLATDSIDDAADLAAALDSLNRERREMVEIAYGEAVEQVEERGMISPLVWAAGTGWHPGIVGIVASRLSELTNRPAIAVSLSGEVGRGSARSVPGIDIGSAVMRCREEGLLTNGGGHRMAAGLQVEPAHLEPAMKRLCALLEAQGQELHAPRERSIDGEIQPEAATVELIESLEAAGPFGSGAPHPRVVLPFQNIVFRRVVGDGHLQLTMLGASRSRLNAIAFRAMKGPLGSFLESRANGAVHLMGRLEIDTYRGRVSPKLHIEDAAPA